MQIVSNAIEWYAEHCSDRLALAYLNSQFTYRELHQLANEWASNFRSLGISSMHRVLIVMDNDPAFVIATIALTRIGASVVFINTGLSNREISLIGSETKCCAIITEQKYLKLAQHLIHIEQPPVVLYKEELMNSNELKAMEDRKVSNVEVSNEQAQPELIFFTSGSTGKPKGIVIHQSKLDMTLTSYSLAPPVTNFLARPLFFRAHFSSLCFMLQEGKTILLCEQFEPKLAFGLIEKYEARQLVSSPYDLLALANWMKTEGLTMPVHMKEWVSTGTSLHPNIREEIRHFSPPIRLTDLYGLSEIGAIAMIDHNQWEKKEGSIGRPSFFVKIRIVGEHLEELPVGEWGEICVKSRFMMDHYFNDDALNEQAFIDGYIRTGDIGHIDRDGYLYVEGRKDQSINRAGYIFHPAEIENVLRNHFHVEHVAVIRSIDEFGLQTPVAYVQTKGNTLAKDVLIQELYDHCIAHLSAFKIPEKYIIIDQMPLNAAGKINISNLQRMS